MRSYRQLNFSSSLCRRIQMLAKRTLWFVHLLPLPSTGCVNRKEPQHLVCRRRTCLFKMIHFILQKNPVKLADNKLSCMSLEIQSRVPVKRKCQFTKPYLSLKHWIFPSKLITSTVQILLSSFKNSTGKLLWCLSNHHCVLIKERVLRNLEAQHKVKMKITI